MKKFLSNIIKKILISYIGRVISKQNPTVIAIVGQPVKMKEIVSCVLTQRFGESIRTSPKTVKTKIELMLDILGYNFAPPQILWPFFLIGAYFRSNKYIFPNCLIFDIAKVELLGEVSGLLKLDIAIANTNSEQIYLLDHSLKEKGKLIISADNRHLPPEDNRILSVGIKNREADYYASDFKASNSGCDFRICTTGQKISVHSRLSNDEAIYSKLAAFAVGQIFKIQSLKIKNSLENLG